jgi:hypothetical protein
MALRSGLANQWAALDETTYGVAPTLTGAPFYAAKSDSLGLKKVTKQGTGIFAGSLAARGSRRVVTGYNAGGSLMMELPERGMNPWLYRMLGSFGQSAAALTQDGTTGAYSATHALGPLEGHSFALQAGRPTVDGTVVPFTYTGCKVQEWEVSCALGDVAELALTIEARNELALSNVSPHVDSLNASVPSLLAYSAPPAGSVFRWLGGSILYGGTASTTSGVTSISSPTVAANLTGTMSLKCSRPLDLDRYAPDVAPYRNEPIQNGLTAITGSFGVEWLSAGTYYAAYQADTATAIQLKFTTVPIGSGSDVATFSLMVPLAKLNGEPPKSDGPQVLTQTVPWDGLDDGANNILQATYWTLDSA